MNRSRISGVGLGTPSKVVTNQDLEKTVDTNDEWIVTRTGIRERKILDYEIGETHLWMCERAARQAIEKAGLEPKDIDYVILATLAADTFMPMGSARLVDALGIRGVGSYDLHAACGGWLVGLHMADALIRAGKQKRILLLGAEAISRVIDWTDRNTCVLFGDGAAATVVEATEVKDEKSDSFVLGTRTYTWPDMEEALVIPGGALRTPPHHELYGKREEMRIGMDGQAVFKSASKGMALAAKEVFEECGVSPADVKWFVPHQANLRIIEMVAKLLEFPMEKTFVNIDRWGNTSAATIPICLAEMDQQGLLNKGDLLLLDTFGGGFTFGAALVRW